MVSKSIFCPLIVPIVLSLPPLITTQVTALLSARHCIIIYVQYAKVFYKVNHNEYGCGPFACKESGERGKCYCFCSQSIICDNDE